jgi:hypothetical protein
MQVIYANESRSSRISTFGYLLVDDMVKSIIIWPMENENEDEKYFQLKVLIIGCFELPWPYEGTLGK